MGLQLDNGRRLPQSGAVEIPPVLQPASATPRKKRRGWLIVAIAVAAIVVAFGVVAFVKTRTPPITVQTEKVSRHSITNVVVANGKIQPVVQVSIAPEVSGEIIELPFKEGQRVKKGDLLVRINPDIYEAAVSQSKASYASSQAYESQAAANLEKAEADFKRNEELFQKKLLSESDFASFKAARDVARAQLQSATNQVDMAHAEVDSAQKQLDRTTILAPIDGTISKLNSQLGERVLGMVQNVGTVIMVISDLSQMEARVDIGEMDVVNIAPGQKARLEVDAFKDRKFAGVVTNVASSSKDSNLPQGYSSSGSSQTQEATKFQVRILFAENESFRPGMSCSAEIETTYRTNVLTVPLASVTIRPVVPKKLLDPPDPPAAKGTNVVVGTNAVAGTNIVAVATTNAAPKTNAVATASSSKESPRPMDVVFVLKGNRVEAVPVKIGICDDNYWEITDGLTNGEEIVIGGYRAISRDLQDGSKIQKGAATAEMSKN
jgi:HlyD family secretion protein